ncbi:MBL fold metallo-hydrolase [Longitalea arenae]|uniref:MBL fold metallo-hydrolase n=1 Tax=Longitalea arenae TaxID=2812558 RepID=UPI001967C9A7|nr:MBL fold metallo-hydrolase [Longitalea arenae]
MKVSFLQVDTACMVIDINGFVIVTDPAFDVKGTVYEGPRTLYKTGSPSLQPGDIGPVDLVLLSHDQHKDNLDNAGRAFIKTVKQVISTPGAVERLAQNNVTGLHEWESIDVPTDKVPGLRITATPCQHAPTQEQTKISGHVIGFIIEWEGQQKGALYVSGDTVYFDGIEEIAKRFKVHTAILHVGKAGFPEINYMPLTFTTEMAIKTARLLKVEKFIPTHFEGWKHFNEGAEYLYDQIIHSDLKEKLLWLQPGSPAVIEI